jgi:hypothetical protein
MMTFTNAYVCASGVLVPARSILKRAYESKSGLDFHRTFLNSVRDNLHAGCVHFEDNGGAEAHEEIYLSLFDALSFLTNALRQTPIHRPDVRAALHRLNELADLLDAVPV